MMIHRALPSLGLSMILALSGCYVPPEAREEKTAEIEKDEAEVKADNELRLAGVMIRDGHYDRAEVVLKTLDPKARAVDTARFYTLRGLLFLNQRKYSDCREDLMLALKNSPREKRNPSLYLYLAQANYGLNDYQGTVDAIDRLSENHRKISRIHQMRINSYWQLKKHSSAFSAIEVAEDRFPKNPQFAKLRLLYLLELGFNTEAVSAAQRFLKVAGRSPESYLTLGEALRRSRQFEQALQFLEQARLEYPQNEKIYLSLAHCYLDFNKPRLAGKILESLAILKPQYISETAELYRRANETQRALYLNAQLNDQSVKMRQRLGILVQKKSWEEAYALKPRLKRLGLLGDQHVSYAMAFVSFQSGHYDVAKSLLENIRDNQLYKSALKLRRAIEVAEKEQSGRS